MRRIPLQLTGRSLAFVPMLVFVALATGGAALGTSLALSTTGILLLATGFSLFSLFRAISIVLSRKKTDPKKPGKPSRRRWIVLSALGSLTLGAWAFILVYGDASGLVLFIAGVFAFALFSYAAWACTPPRSIAQWIVGSLATATAGVNGNYFAAFSSTLAANGAGVQSATNWGHISGLVRDGLSPLRSALGIVVRTTDEIKADTAAIRQHTAEIKEDTNKIKQDSKALSTQIAGVESFVRAQLTSGSKTPVTRLSKGNLNESAPPSNTLLLSRAAFRASVLDWAQASEGSTAVALVGELGVNTSDIARDVAAALDPASPSHAGAFQEIWWFDARVEHNTPSEVIAGRLTRLLWQLGRPPEKDGDVLALARATRAALAEGPKSFFVVDGLTDEILLANLLPRGSCTTLVTTQRADLPSQLIPIRNVPRLTDDEAFAVLTAQRPDLLSARGDPAFGTIFSELQGNDIALEVAAAYLARQSRPTPKELVDALSSNTTAEAHPFNVAAFSSRASGDDRTVARMLAAAWADLPEGPELHLLRCAAWCTPEHIPLRLLESATGVDPAPALAAAESLANRSILRLTRKAGDYTVSVSRPVQRILQGAQSQSTDHSERRVIADLLDALCSTMTWSAAVETQMGASEWDHRCAACLPHAFSAISNVLELEKSSKDQIALPDLASKVARLQAEAGWFLLRTGSLVEAAFNLGAAISWYESQTPRDDKSLAALYFYRSDLRQNLGDLKGALADITRNIEWGESQKSRDEKGLADDYASRANILRAMGDTANARIDIQKSIDWGMSQRPRDERALAVWHVIRAKILRDLGDLKGADEDIGRSISWEEAQKTPDERELIVRLAARSSIREARGDLSGAEQDTTRAIQIGESLVPRDERGIALDYSSRAKLRQSQGNLRGALDDITTSIESGESQTPRNTRSLSIRYATRSSIREALFDLRGADDDITTSIADNESAISYLSRARIRQSRGFLDTAEADASWSIHWLETHFPRNDQGIAVCYSARASIRANLGRLDDAASDIAKSITWEESQPPKTRTGLPVLYFIRANIRRDRGALAEAEEDIASSIDASDSDPTIDQRQRCKWIATRASICRDRGALDDAMKQVSTAIEWFEAHQPKDEQTLMVFYGLRATIRSDSGDLSGAEADITRSVTWFRSNQPDNRHIVARLLRDQARVQALGNKWTEAQAAIDEAISFHEQAFGAEHEWTRKARMWQSRIRNHEAPLRWTDTK